MPVSPQHLTDGASSHERPCAFWSMTVRHSDHPRASLSFARMLLDQVAAELFSTWDDDSLGGDMTYRRDGRWRPGELRNRARVGWRLLPNRPARRPEDG